jgi:hypothetical protein
MMIVRHFTQALVIVAGVSAIALCLPSGAAAHEGDFAKFNDCPSTTTGVWKCVDSITTGGSIVLGKKTTPIVHPVTLQGGFAEENAEGFSSFFAASDGETLTKTPQPVPGGIVGLVPPESAPLLVKLALAIILENGLTGVNATLELAKPASEIVLSEFNLIVGEGLALKLPVKIHLENPLLGSACYVGSSTHPIIWNLTSGTTSPPAPTEPITGKPGFASLKDNFEIAELTENELVENNWAAPEATGCGGALSALINPIIDTTVGLPAAAGKNSAKLINNIAVATKVSVNEH